MLAIRSGYGLSGGIDLDAPTSVSGAFGTAAVNLLILDDTLSEDAQRLDLARNLAVICAGAAADAKVSGIDPVDALRAQPGDHALALDHALRSSIVQSEEEAEYVVLNIGLGQAVRLLDQFEIWAAVERVAAAVLAASGKLDADRVKLLGAI